MSSQNIHSLSLRGVGGLLELLGDLVVENTLGVGAQSLERDSMSDF